MASPSGPDACQERLFEGSTFVACSYRAGSDELRLAWGDASGPFGGFDALRRSLGASSARVRFAMNAGMYRPDQRPVGLLVVEGRTLQPLNTAQGQGNFFLKPNGVFWVGRDGRAHVEETGVFAERKHSDVRWATQSGPLMVSAARLHGGIAADGASRKIRNAVGARDGQAAFVISLEPVSFGRLARFMRDDLQTPDALYLDGAVSSLWSPATGRRDGRTGLGPLVVVLAGGQPR